MRNIIVAGNWKMNKTIDESVDFVKTLQEKISTQIKPEVLIFPPFTSLYAVNVNIDKNKIKHGAQNMHFEKSGAFTGEISADMIKSCGCEYVILGHSERRHIFMESDGIISKKVATALENGLKPVICIGEKLEERQAGKTEEVLKRQFESAFSNVSDEQVKDCIIAYEPVWAIGTGINATPEQASDAHIFVRSLLKENYTDEVAESTPILYGGSVKPENCRELFEKDDVDGFLIGGASLKIDSFLSIILTVNEMIS
ncbi:MAG: triose-phosphate isomerase [Candidatus Marinimicrobia bacterium]|nr:triose-phosphate isomerase [Candidatus Neomarinimicrobiota bacterium]